MKSFGFKHKVWDYYTSLRFSGGSVTLASCPAVGNVHTVAGWVRHVPGVASTIYANGAVNVQITTAGLLRTSGGNQVTQPLTGYEWTHVAFTCDGVNTKVYINGEIVGVFTSNAVSFAGGAGSIQMASGAHLCDLRVYSTALEQSDIRALFYANSGATPVLWFPFDEGGQFSSTTTVPVNDGTGNATATLGANVAYDHRVPKVPIALPIDSGSIITDGATANGTATPTAGGLTALLGITGGTGFTLSMWLRVNRNAGGTMYPFSLNMGGGTIIRGQHRPEANVSQFSTIRANSGGSGSVSGRDLRHRSNGLYRWAQMAVSIDVSEGRISTYGDGVLMTTEQSVDFQSAGWYTGATPFNDFRLGSAAAASGNFWPGAIADVRMYRRALSKAEHRALYLGKLAAEDVQWKFREATGNQCNNSGSLAGANLFIGSACQWSTMTPR